MGWNNPDMPWSELERRLSGRAQPDGGDGPGFSRKRPRYEPTDHVHAPLQPTVPYAELHVHSHYSFLDGASSTEALVEEAVRLGLHGLALTDHDSFAGAPTFAEAAQAWPGLRTVYGAELSLDLTRPQNGVADPEGQHLLVLARGVEGYHRLSAAMTEAHLRGDEKGRPDHDREELSARGRDHWVVLTGCRKGAVRQALASGGRSAAADALDRLTALFGLDGVVVELTRHDHPLDDEVNDVLADLAADHGLPVVATGAVHLATPAHRRLGQAMAAVRARRSLAEMDGWLDAASTAFLRSGEEMAVRFARYPGAVERSVLLADEIGFDLQKARPQLPVSAPDGHTPMSWLRELVRRGADRRYGHIRDEAEVRLQRELAVIEEKDFPGYFLIVEELVSFAREEGILCQGRGSSANSAICYALGITAVDAIAYDLPFERFLASTREEEPDIDVDFDSDRREEVIQHVYRTYGRRNAAQVANVIMYRPRSAVRDAAKALGYSPGQQDAWSKNIERWGEFIHPDDTRGGGAGPRAADDTGGGAGPRAADDTGGGAGPRAADDTVASIPKAVVELATQFLSAPRHLGIHSGGMVLTRRPVGEVCPIERARMDDRTVLQWDKDASAWMGLVKFDLLGLGMLGALQHTFDLVSRHLGETWGLDTMPKEEAGTYDMLCKADSIGVFQVESRAQIGTLPRLQPRRFYDLAIEIALIRPGPIQGGAVHPYIRRATGGEPVTYPHPVLKPVLERTKGVPLFQEQLMQIAIAIGDCTGDEADLLRRAMGSKRGLERIETLREKLFAGMAKHGIVAEEADAMYLRIQSFANFGFAESHALSFALLVYASSWLKLHYPAAFCAALLRNQPMGFYSPQSLVGDARRHGVETRRPDITRSQVHADLEPIVGEGAVAPTGLESCTAREQPEVPRFAIDADHRLDDHRRDGNLALRLGLTDVLGIGEDVARRVVAAREERPFTGMADVARRTGLTTAQMESLATAGAFDAFGIDRRQALWNAGHTDAPDLLDGTAVAAPPPTLPGMSDVELTVADLWSTSISPGEHPFAHLRPLLRREGVLSVAEAMAIDPPEPGETGRAGPEPGGGAGRGAADGAGTWRPAARMQRGAVAGLITHRQRPMTAGGVTFLNLEDETGMLNVVVFADAWERFRRVFRTASAVVIEGQLEVTEHRVVNLVATRIERVETLYPQAAGAVPARHRARNFQ